MASNQTRGQRQPLRVADPAVAVSTAAGAMPAVLEPTPGPVAVLSSVAEEASGGDGYFEVDGLAEAGLRDRITAVAEAANTIGNPSVAYPLHRLAVTLSELRMTLVQALPVAPEFLRADLQRLQKLL